MRCFNPSDRRGRIKRTFYRFFAWWIIFSFILQVPLAQMSHAADIVPDGRTQTTVTVTGSVTDVTTQTVRGRNAYNSFDRFNVPGGTTTNLHVPNAAASLINLVHKEQTNISGILNAYQNGQIGGNVFFLNPHGVIIGPTGVVNVGSFTALTPSAQYMNDFISPTGQISSLHEQMLFEGNVPLSDSGVISVKGKINAANAVRLEGGNVFVDVGAAIRAGNQVRVDFGQMVNVDGILSGNELEITPDGKISIVAQENVNVAGLLSVDGTAGANAGDIEVLAGNDIVVADGAVISARGAGENSAGGNIIIFADNDATLASGGKVDVSGGTSGDAGFIEFSARETVYLHGGGLHAAAQNGRAGTILIDPRIIDGTSLGEDLFSHGADINLIATESIILNNVIISSRDVGGSTDRDVHKAGNSTDNSGNIKLEAPTIELTNSQILAHATGIHSAGDVTILLNDNDWGNQYDFGGRAEVSFSMDKDSVISGKDVVIKATAGSGTRLADVNTDGSLTEEQEKDFLDTVVGGLESILDTIVGTVSSLGATGRDNRAKASITIDGQIIATGEVGILALAEAHAEFSNNSVILAGSGARVDADSSIKIGENARISSGIDKDVTITSKAVTVMDISSTEWHLVNAVPGDISFSFGIAESTNVVDVAHGAEITSGKDLTITALTERNHEVSVSGGNSGESALGLSVAVLYGNAETKLNVDGELEAAGNLTLSAQTNTEANSVGASSNIGPGFWANVTKSVNDMTGVLDKISGGVGSIVEKIFGVDISGPNNPWAKLGISGALAFMHDDVETGLVVGSNAKLAAKNISVTAETVNQVLLGSSAFVSEYKSNGKDTKKENAVALSVALAFMDNKTTAVVKKGAVLKADEAVAIEAKTTIPYNLDHPIYNAITDWNNFSLTELTDLLDWNLGAEGFL
ncbi:MAG: leukotoxin LktA family filamentous adhesin, partial [Syntrophobacterales bacterium]|nr:leukotoxin LktA family filamentous adhesin [Syntrophobacterales bacterium]